VGYYFTPCPVVSYGNGLDGGTFENFPVWCSPSVPLVVGYILNHGKYIRFSFPALYINAGSILNGSRFPRHRVRTVRGIVNLNSGLICGKLQLKRPGIKTSLMRKKQVLKQV